MSNSIISSHPNNSIIGFRAGPYSCHSQFLECPSSPKGSMKYRIWKPQSLSDQTLSFYKGAQRHLWTLDIDDHSRL